MHQEVLSKTQLQEQLRANDRVQLADPGYVEMYRGPRRLPQAEVDANYSWSKYVGRLGSLRKYESYAQWLTRLDSKTWRVQLRGRREAQVVNRVVRISRGNERGWSEVALNSRA